MGHTCYPPRTEVFKGLFKLVEEMSECLVILGKLGPFPDGDHPDGKGHLYDRLREELVDVEAAIQYFRETNGFAGDGLRYSDKIKKFRQWGLTGISPKPDDHG